jgi:ferredoxin-type protein NapH
MSEESVKLQRVRTVKQLISSVLFLLILALCWFFPLLGFFIPLCMLLGIGFGLWRGRVWCNWYCPRGSFYDSIVSNFSPKRAIPGIFKNIHFRLSVLVLLMAVMSVNLVIRLPDINKIGLFFVMMLSATTILGIILAFIFHQRSWCTICPIGTIVNLISRNKYPLKIDSELCIDCKLCAKICPVQIDPSRYRSKGMQLVNDADCLKCGLCVAVCPKKALSR